MPPVMDYVGYNKCMISEGSGGRSNHLYVNRLAMGSSKYYFVGRGSFGKPVGQ